MTISHNRQEKNRSMGTEHIWFISGKEFPFVPRALNERYLKSNHFVQVNLEDNNAAFNDESVLIIFEPVKIDGINYSIYKIWKRYFELHFPLSKIIVAGFINQKDPNYLNLVNLPDDFQTFLSHALPVNADWEAPVDCTDILERMRQFFKGHGKESLISQLNRIQQSLNVVYVTVMNDENSFQEVRDSLLFPYFMPEWRELSRRWDNYFSLFEYLPFLLIMQSVDNTFREISRFIDGSDITNIEFMKRHFDDKIRSVIQKLMDIDKEYIRPEIYYEK